MAFVPAGSLRLLILAAASLTAFQPCAAATAEPQPKPSGLPAVRARESSTLSLRSPEGLDYRIFMSVPAGDPPPGGFPVLYVLDANAWFGVAAEMTRLYELEGGPAVVVGIGYPVDTLYAPLRRGHDFTLGPPANGKMSVYAGADFGGADRFLSFLRGQVRDTIAAKVPIDRKRQSLFGHSLGGYFVMHVLLTQPDAFAAYAAASPALWWDLPKIDAEAEVAKKRARPTRPPRVIVTAGSAEQALGSADTNLFRRLYAANPKQFGGKSIEQVLAETNEELSRSRMVDNARGAAAQLTALGIPAEFVAFDQENHRSSVAPALGRAMPFFFQAEP
jgi:predicted alpha/beta superfamily hydrolase